MERCEPKKGPVTLAVRAGAGVVRGFAGAAAVVVFGRDFVTTRFFGGGFGEVDFFGFGFVARIERFGGVARGMPHRTFTQPSDRGPE